MLSSSLIRRILVAGNKQGSRGIYDRSRIGNRDVVGYGINGCYIYKDDPQFPFPAIRFMQNDRYIQHLREREAGDWRDLTLEEKKALYRASFCQTFAEFQHPTGQWKFILGWVLILLSFAFWMQIFNHFFVHDEPPASLSPESQRAQLRRMLELRVNPVDGLASQWDYENDRWKETFFDKIENWIRGQDMKCAVAIVLALIGMAVASPVPSGYIASPLLYPASVSSTYINHGVPLPKVVVTAPIIRPVIHPVPVLVKTPLVSHWGYNSYGWH